MQAVYDPGSQLQELSRLKPKMAQCKPVVDVPSCHSKLGVGDTVLLIPKGCEGDGV